MSPEEDRLSADCPDLREQVIARASHLLRQLAVDRSDLQKWAERGDSPTTAAGIAAITRVMEAAERVGIRLQNG